jgi:looped-hinge helix DNA binding domain, AbrB family
MSKSTGIVRKIDELGRVVLPKELRKTFGLERNSPVEIFTNDHQIILQKYEPSCMICNSCEDIVYVGSKKICKECHSMVKDRIEE